MKFTSHAQGTPCWVELATTDQAAAKAFYADLFGWDYEDSPIDETGDVFYSMAMTGGAFVGGMYEQPEDQREAGIPPHWMIHIAVDDVDAIAARVPGLGGTVGAPPFDVFNAGRMSIISDPAGAYVALWQAKRHIGAGVKSEPNTIHWCELLANDPDAVTAFYTELLGMDSETMTMDQGGEYTIFLSGGAAWPGPWPCRSTCASGACPRTGASISRSRTWTPRWRRRLPTAPTWPCHPRTSPWWAALPT